MTQASPLATPMPWNLVAPAYAEEVVPMFESFAREALRLAAAPPGSRIVDVACGPGTLSVLAAEAGHAVDALDFSTGMLERLDARAKARAITAITARLGDGQALPYEDGTFAAGFSMFGLMFFPDRAKGFSELRRVLAPGARAVVSSWHAMDTVPVIAAMFAAIREAMGEAMGAGAPAGASPNPLTTEAACREEMAVAFADVEVHTRSFTDESPSADALWESLVRTMAPVLLMRKALGEDRWPAVDAAARSAIRGVVGSGPARLTMNAWLAVGVAR
jgi:SAM-dependent methyltransferase